MPLASISFGPSPRCLSFSRVSSTAVSSFPENFLEAPDHMPMRCWAACAWNRKYALSQAPDAAASRRRDYSIVFIEVENRNSELLCVVQCELNSIQVPKLRMHN